MELLWCLLCSACFRAETSHVTGVYRERGRLAGKLQNWSAEPILDTVTHAPMAQCKLLLSWNNRSIGGAASFISPVSIHNLIKYCVIGRIQAYFVLCIIPEELFLRIKKKIIGQKGLKRFLAFGSLLVQIHKVESVQFSWSHDDVVAPLTYKLLQNSRSAK